MSMDRLIGKIEIKDIFDNAEFESLVNLINILVDKMNELNDDILKLKIDMEILKYDLYKLHETL